MRYALTIGFRYLASKKTKTVSVITSIAIGGVALGVAALLSVMAITSGFQEEFRNKVLGVNAHVLVMKYGDFEEYRDVVSRAREMPEVAGAGPFLIRPMMLANGDRISGVLLKGVDPDLMPDVLDLPAQMVDGTLEGMRATDATPPMRAEERDRIRGGGEDLDAYLRAVDAAYRDRDGASAESLAGAGFAAVEGGPAEPVAAAGEDEGIADTTHIDLPDVTVPSPEDAELALALDEPVDPVAEATATAHEPAVPTAQLPGLVVGRTLATELSIEVGDRVRIVSPLAGFDRSVVGDAGGDAPRSRELRVIGVFEAGFQEYDSELVYTDLFEAEQFFEHGDAVDGVEIRLHDPDDAASVSRRLETDLGGGAYHTMDWEELNHNLFEALEIQKLMLSIVYASVVFVASFTVIATLIMMVLEKKKQISILKAMGAKDSHVLLVFLSQGMAIGVVGTTLGTLVGGGVCLYLDRIRFPLDPRVYLIDHLPVRLSLSEVGWTVVVALAISLLATLVPSWWAARMVPADGVRQE